MNLVPNSTPQLGWVGVSLSHETLLQSDGEEDDVIAAAEERKTEDKNHYVINAWKKESSLPDGWLMRKIESKEYCITDFEIP